MAVLVEAISVIVRRSAITAKYRGGWPAFVGAVPNATLCSDEDVARIGFTSPADVERFVAALERGGLRFLDGDMCADLAVVDQQSGPTMKCDWLEFAKLSFGDRGKVSACWLFEGPRIAEGLHVSSKGMALATPEGWTYEGSLSEKFGFVPLNSDGSSDLKGE